MDSTKRYITKIARAALRYASGELRKSGVGFSEYDCLHAIRKNQGINQEGIGELLNIDKAAVARMIVNLEKKGFVYREKDTNDRRRNKVYSTEKALSVKFSETNAESLFYEWLMEDITPDEEEAFICVLEKLYMKSKNERLENFSNVKVWQAARKEKLCEPDRQLT